MPTTTFVHFVVIAIALSLGAGCGGSGGGATGAPAASPAPTTAPLGAVPVESAKALGSGQTAGSPAAESDVPAGGREEQQIEAGRSTPSREAAKSALEGSLVPPVPGEASVLRGPSGPGASSSDISRVREITVPGGTSLTVRLSSDVSSEGRVEDRVRAVVSKPVVVSGVTVVPEGAELRGTIVDAKSAGRVKGRASVAFRFDTLAVGSARTSVRTDRIVRTAAATKGEDAKKVGIGAGAGAVLGAITGGKKGAAIGSAVGAGGGAGVVLATRGREVHLPSGSVLAVRLAAPVTLTVRER